MTPDKHDARLIVVTGLPRSGTSLLMQMLRAGGMQLLVDERRSADEHNPQGYFEYEPVKRIETDASWLSLAHGKAVKIVVPLVKVVASSDRPALILLVRRDMDAVLRSQRRMAEACGATVTESDQRHLAQVFTRELDETVRLVSANLSQDLVEIRYEDVLGTPLRAASQLADVLPACVDATAMASVVDRGLNRSGE